MSSWLMGEADGAPPAELTAKEARRRWLARLEGWTRVSGGLLERPLHAKGAAPRVVITTEQRRGHHVTLVSELSLYTIDPYAAARELQVLCGATANVAGYPDVGLLTMTEVCRTIREVADASGLPVVADADTGYGEVECAVRTTIEYERAGAAAWGGTGAGARAVAVARSAAARQACMTISSSTCAADVQDRALVQRLWRHYKMMRAASASVASASVWHLACGSGASVL